MIRFSVEASRENTRGNRCPYREQGLFAEENQANACVEELVEDGFRCRVYRVELDVSRSPGVPAEVLSRTLLRWIAADGTVRNNRRRT